MDARARIAAIIGRSAAASGRRASRRLALSAALALTSALALVPASASADTTPTVSGETASEVGVSTARLSGQVNPNGTAGDGNTSWHLDFRVEGTSDWSQAGSGTIEAPVSEEPNPVEVEAVFGFNGELTPGETYEFRLVAENAAGPAETAAPYPTFTMDSHTDPVLTIDPVTVSDRTTAHLSGTIDPEGGNVNPIGPEVFPIFWELQYSSDGTNWTGVAGEPISGAQAEGTDPVEVKAEATGLEPATAYQARLHVVYSNFSSFSREVDSPQPNAAFETEAVAPKIESTFVSGVTATEATLNARINPGGAASTYRFQYVSQAQFEADGFAQATLTPNTQLKDKFTQPAEDNVAHPATATIAGLDPDTTYRYRVLATNSADAVTGPDRVLHTYELPNTAPDSCPNAAIRAEQHATFLPDCRAYEMVSPPEKNGTNVNADSGRTRLTPDCSADCAITFATLTGFGDVRGTGIASDYIAERAANRAPGNNGWTTHSITPPQDSMAYFEAIRGLEPGYRGAFSANLRKGIFFTFSPLTDAPNVKELGNLYLRDDLRTSGPGSYQLLTDTPTPQTVNIPGEGSPVFAGRSDDLTHIVFMRTPTTSNPGPQAYLWTQGQVDRVGILPGGADARCGDDTALCSLIGKGLLAYSEHENAISSDGERIVFTAPVDKESHEGELYQRINNAQTVHINESERSIHDEPLPARFEWASQDGSRIFFSTFERLTDDDPDSLEQPHSDLYRYDADAPATKNLVRISVDSEPSDPGSEFFGILGISDDGASVYFVASGLLVPSAGGLGGLYGGVYLWHGGTIRLVVPIGFSDVEYNTYSEPLAARDGARVTADGSHMSVTLSNGDRVLSLRGDPDYDHAGTRQIYLYDANADLLRCASCSPSGTPGSAHVETTLRKNTGPSTTDSNINRALATDGRYVFFTTRASLLPERDTNGVSDPYAYDAQTRTLDLLSSGVSESPSYFVEASADGSDAFVSTQQRMVGWDRDANYDLYDVRVNGGFPEPPPMSADCIADACRPAATSPPADRQVAQVAGPGNPSAKRCPKGTRKITSRNGEIRCHRRKRAHSGHRRASHRRRAGK